MMPLLFTPARRRASTLAATVIGAWALFASAGQAEGGQVPGAPPEVRDDGAAAGVPASELQRLFDAYTLMQAQEALRLNDEQYPKFLARLRALQDVRRRNQMARLRTLQQLRLLVQGADTRTDAERVRELLKELRTIDDRMASEVARATDAIDEVLEPAQQARLRLFEEQMERRKLELLMRARRGRALRR